MDHFRPAHGTRQRLELCVGLQGHGQGAEVRGNRAGNSCIFLIVSAPEFRIAWRAPFSLVRALALQVYGRALHYNCMVAEAGWRTRVATGLPVRVKTLIVPE